MSDEAKRGRPQKGPWTVTMSDGSTWSTTSILVADAVRRKIGRYEQGYSEHDVGGVMVKTPLTRLMRAKHPVKVD